MIKLFETQIAWTMLKLFAENETDVMDTTTMTIYTKEQWAAKEAYDLKNGPFTREQWEAIQRQERRDKRALKK